MPNPTVSDPEKGEQRLEVVKLEGLTTKVKEYRGDTFLCVSPENLTQALKTFRDDPDLRYDYFVECTGVDYSTWKHERDLPGRFEVVYNLFSTKNNSRIFVKTSVDDGQTIPTMIPLWSGAEFPEREVTDLFGVVFEGNNPRPGERFLLPDDWSGFPLRKEFPLGGEDVLFDLAERGPAVEDVSMPHAGESFEGKTGSEDVSGR
jgi:NADH-quinone oxidoreductase subunit C